MKRILSAIISAIIVICCVFKIPTSNKAFAATNGLKVGELTIFASSSSSGGSSAYLTGHAFLSFKNTSDSSILIGGMLVGSGYEITFGTFNLPDFHNGIWYNLESYYVNIQGGYSDRASLTMNVSQANVNSINALISTHDYWTITENCSTFATLIWNDINAMTLSAGYFVDTPTSLKADIMSKSGYQIGRSIMYTGPIGYLNTSGNFVTVSPNSVPALDWSCPS